MLKLWIVHTSIERESGYYLHGGRTRKWDGFEVYSLLSKEYEPDLAGRHTATLMSLLHPHWPTKEKTYVANLVDFMSDLADWERRIIEYERATGEVFADRMKIATVFKNGPLELRRVLQGQAWSIGANYVNTRTQIESYVSSGRVFATQPNSSPIDTSAPMDVGAIN
eukprot:6464328-Amphidinium_carterae.1